MPPPHVLMIAHGLSSTPLCRLMISPACADPNFRLHCGNDGKTHAETQPLRLAIVIETWGCGLALQTTECIGVMSPTCSKNS